MRALATSLLLLIVTAPALSQTTTKYTLTVQDRPSGSQTTTVAADGSMKVFFTYRDNGRGPDINETIRVASDGTITQYQATGKSTFGAPINETFAMKGGVAMWRSDADRGSTSPGGAAIYQPVESSLEIPAITARALLKAPSGKLPGLPGGQLSIEKLADLTLRNGADARAISLYAISGVDTEPTFLWLNSTDQRLFGFTYFGGAVRMTEAGWEASGAELDRAQQRAEQAMLHDLKQQLAHQLPNPIVIRNVNVFDAEAGKTIGTRDVYVDRGQIAAIYPANSKVHEAGTIIDGTGKTLAPSLFDMHAHQGAWDALLQIAAGVTTVRDLGNTNNVLRQLIADIDAGTIVGPRLLPAGFIEGESQFASQNGFIVKSMEEAKDAVDCYAQHGYRQIISS